MNSQLENKLTVIPPLPNELVELSPFVQCTLTHSNIISTLLLIKQRGLIVREHPENVFDLTITTSKKQKKISLGCLFIPIPNFGRIFVIKAVSDLSRDGAVAEVCHQIQQQLTLINRDFKNIDSLKTSVLRINCRDFYYNLHFNFINRDTIGQELKPEANFRSVKPVFIEKLINYYCEKLNYECFYCPSSNKLKFGSNPCFDIENKDAALEVLNFFFPQRHQKLETIPCFNRMTDNMLFNYSGTGEVGSFAGYAAYMGEVRLFSENFLNKLRNHSGLFIRGFSNQHLGAIAEIENSKTANFEIDWLYLGTEQIVAFEVGMSENPSNKHQTAIRNKITQCLENIIPQMQLIISSLWRVYQKKTTTSKPSFQNLIQNSFKVVIFLPNIETKVLVNQIGAIKKLLTDPTPGNSGQHDFVELLKQNGQQVTKYLSFLTSSEASGGGFAWIHVNENWDIEETKGTIHRLIEGVGVTDWPKCRDSFVEYVSACFCCASLSFSRVISEQTGRIERAPLQIEEHYSPSFKKFKISKVYTNLNLPQHLNFILSPQQYQILSDKSNHHLIITGQPGTGKTTLLVAKCELLAWEDNIKKIHYFYTSKRKLFGKFLENLIETSCSEHCKNKIIVRGIHDVFDISKKCRKLTQVLT